MTLAAPAGVWFALDHEPRPSEGVASVLPQLEAVLRFARELHGRLAEAGIDGVPGALEHYRRLRVVLDSVSDAEITRVLQEVAALSRAITHLGKDIEELRRLKHLVTTTAEKP
jgi:hypothetical protein